MVQIAADGYFKVATGDSTKSATAYVDSASLNFNNGNEDITGLGDKWHNYTGTIRDWGGNLSFSLDLADAAQAKMFDLMTGSSRVTGVAIEMAIGSAKKVSGTILLSDFNLSMPVAGVVGGTCSFKGCGAPVIETIS